MNRHPSFSQILDLAAGRTGGEVARHLEACSACRVEAERAGRLLAAGRRALAERGAGARLLDRAVRIFLRERLPAPGRFFRLAFDSWLSPAPALRGGGAPRPRFLRFEGPATVEVEIRKGSRGRELTGRVEPPGYAEEAVLDGGGRSLRARVESDGAFRFLRLPTGRLRLTLGTAPVGDIE